MHFIRPSHPVVIPLFSKQKNNDKKSFIEFTVCFRLFVIIVINYLNDLNDLLVRRQVMLKEHIEKLIRTSYKLITLETNSPIKSIDDFRPLVRDGKAIYLWKKETGLRRVETSHISIPNTSTPELVLKHIKQNKLYGIYLLVGFNKELKKRELHPFLKQIAIEKNKRTIVILIDDHFDYPHILINDILMTQEPEVRKLQALKKIA
jgi:hypothetical protein